MPIVANSATRSKSVPLTLERKRDNEFVEFIIIIYISTFVITCFVVHTPHTMSCSYSVSSIGLFHFAGLFPLPGYSYCGGTSYAGLHSLNLFVSHSIHINSFGYFATLVLSVAILCVVWGILCLICFLFVSHLVPQFIFRRGILFRMKPQCCWVGISLMQR